VREINNEKPSVNREYPRMRLQMMYCYPFGARTREFKNSEVAIIDVLSL